MKTQLVRNEVNRLYTEITSRLSQFKGSKLSYALIKNMRILQREIETYTKMTEPDDDFKAYQSARVALCVKLSEKDEKGMPVVVDNDYKIEDWDVFNEKLEKLKEKHKKAIDAREKDRQEFMEFMKEEVELEVHGIRQQHLSKDITADLVDLIMPFMID